MDRQRAASAVVVGSPRTVTKPLLMELTRTVGADWTTPRSERRLAEVLEVSERSIRNGIQDLTERGYVEVLRSATSGEVNVYRVNLQQGVAPASCSEETAPGDSTTTEHDAVATATRSKRLEQDALEETEQQETVKSPSSTSKSQSRSRAARKATSSKSKSAPSAVRQRRPSRTSPSTSTPQPHGQLSAPEQDAGATRRTTTVPSLDAFRADPEVRAHVVADLKRNAPHRADDEAYIAAEVDRLWQEVRRRERAA